MECQFPTINEPNEAIDEILKNSKNIAIIGLSPDESKDSYKVGKYLLEHGYTIYPIYPKEEYILGQKVYRSIFEIEGEIDIVDVFRKPDVLLDIVNDCIKRGGVKTVWFQLGIVNNEACELAKKHGLKCVQNRCLKIEHVRMANK